MDTAATTRRFASEWQAERGPQVPFHRELRGRAWRAPLCLPCEASSRSRVGAVRESFGTSSVPDRPHLAEDSGCTSGIARRE